MARGVYKRKAQLIQMEDDPPQKVEPRTLTQLVEDLEYSLGTDNLVGISELLVEIEKLKERLCKKLKEMLPY